MLSQLVSAVAGIGDSLMVVVVDVCVLDVSWELGVVHLLAPQQVHLLQIAHSLQQSIATVN